MSLRDQENPRRTNNEIRNSIGHSNEGSSATWFLGVVVVTAIVGGIYVFGADPSVPDDRAPVTAPTD